MEFRSTRLAWILLILLLAFSMVLLIPRAPTIWRTLAYESALTLIVDRSGTIEIALFSSDGSRIITQVRSGSVRLWDLGGTRISKSESLGRKKRHAYILDYLKIQSFQLFQKEQHL